MSEDSIVDTSKPSAGRMYDYYLGGNHNFEIDRQAAERVLKLMPFARKFSMLQRWTLQDIAQHLSFERGYDLIIDFASGLPTNDHIHYKVKPGTTVIYSDIDPIVVEYSREILNETKPENVYMFEANAAHPEELLNRTEVKEIIGGRRKVGIVLWGISSFMSDVDLKHALTYLYDWCETGTCLAFNAQMTSDAENPAVVEARKIYERMGTPVFHRTAEDYLELLKPWKPEDGGFVPLLHWHGLDQTIMTPEDVQVYGTSGGGAGAYFIKE